MDHRRRPDGLFQFGDFCLDAEERVLLSEGRLVPLPAKAVSTLLVLVRKNGHVVEKDTLMKEVWPDEYVEEGNLAQHIFMLRKALGEKSESPKYIETVPRRGYRFIAEITEVDEPNRPINSLAVVPFHNGSNDPDMEYVSEGITQSIITSLSRLTQLKVMAHSMVFRYKGAAVDPQEIGQTLGVRAVLTGNAQRLGERLVISAELVDVRDGSRIWGDEYRREFSDIFSMQEELAREISEKLRLELSGEQKEQLAKRFTENRNAYESYLRGRYAWGRRTNEELRKGVEHFRRAIEMDQNYSLAYAGLADCLLLLGLFGADPPRDVMPKAKSAALKAIQLDGTLGEAYSSLAQISFIYDWDWAKAGEGFQQAVRFSPTYPTGHQWHGEYLASLGLFDQGLIELNKARELDPLSLIINTNIGLTYYWARRYDLAIEQLTRTLELEPGFLRAHLHLGMAYERKRMYPEAVAALTKARSLNENSWTVAALGHAYASFGEKAKADELIARLHELSRREYVSWATFAVLYVGFDDRADQVIEYLEKALEERAGLLVWLRVWPIFDNLRSSPQFISLLKRIGVSN